MPAAAPCARRLAWRQQLDAPLPRIRPWNACDQLDVLRLPAAAVRQAADQRPLPSPLRAAGQITVELGEFPAIGSEISPLPPWMGFATWRGT
jgi:hypothetical protein